MWKERDKYSRIINIVGCFYIILANLKIPHKKCDLLNLRGWWVKSEIIADGPVDKTLERRHSSRGT